MSEANIIEQIDKLKTAVAKHCCVCESCKGVVCHSDKPCKVIEKLKSTTAEMLALTEQFDPPPMTILCSKCGANLTGKRHCHGEYEEPRCYGECENKS